MSLTRTDGCRSHMRFGPARRTTLALTICSHRLRADTPGEGRSWLLKRKRTPCCGNFVPTLEAVVADGRVKRLIVNVGAQGE